MALTMCCAALAQTNTVTFSIIPDDVGLHGVVRAGTWTPIRVTMQNLGSQPREVVYEWVLKDTDGDEVRSRDSVVLTPQSVHHRWLYAVPPFDWNNQEAWKIRLYDKDSGDHLATQNVFAPRPLVSGGGRPTASIGVIGVTGNRLGSTLKPFGLEFTQNERINFLFDLRTTKLPDRWYGLSMLQAIIWTPQGAPPDHSDIRKANRDAIRGWVWRGGHLVIVMQSIGDPWYKSDLADLLPEVEIQDYPDVPHPKFLNPPPDTRTRKYLRSQPILLDVHALKPKAFSNTAIIHQETINGQDVPLVVTHQVGLGRVTVIGIDLTDRRLALNAKLPHGESGFWQKIFAWQSPGYATGQINIMRNAPANNNAYMNDLGNRSGHSIDGSVINGQIAMKETAGGALALAILAFGLYFVATCIVGPIVLRAQKLSRHAWVLFAATVIAFTLFTWGGAMLIRPQSNRIKHYSVIRVDAKTNTFHVHSWLKLLYARHGMIDVEIKAPENGKGHWRHHTLTSAGVTRNETGGGFPDPQEYQFDSANPSSMTVPMRATAKQFELDFIAKSGAASSFGQDVGLTEKWVMPQGKITVDPKTGGLSGSLGHGLPGDLTEVIFIHTRGPNPFEWKFYKVGRWKTGTLLPLPAAMAKPTTGPNFLVARSKAGGENNFLGLLPSIISSAKGYSNDPGANIKVTGRELVKYSQLMSFFDALPPPKYAKRNSFGISHYQRSGGRAMDISKLLSIKNRLIMIGFLEGSPLPAPLLVNGRIPASSGFTMVQWIYELDEPKK